jgi:signal transduction histidine kinase
VALLPGSRTVLAHLVPPVASILLTSLLTAWVSRRRWEVRGARTFVVLLLVGGVGWQAMTVVHVLTADDWLLGHLVVLDKLAGMLASGLFVVFVSQYTNVGYHRRPAVLAALAVQFGGFALLWLTNPLHGLFVSGVSLFGTPFVYAGMERGVLYFVVLGINYALLTLSYYYIVDFLLTTRDDARWQVALLMLGAVSVGTLNTLSIVEFMPLQGFNYGSYGALPFAVLTTVSIFRLGLLDIVPIARKTLVQTLTDPVVVVDEARRVADYNRAAVELWPDLTEHVGDPLAAACPDLADRLTFPEDEETRTDDISLPGRAGTRHFSVLVSPVQKEHRPVAVGYSILVRDVTELEASRRELERQNERLDRVAATISHDLRNPLNVATGRLELLRTELDDDSDAELHAEKIEQAHDRMGEIIEEVLTLAREGRGIDEFAAVDIETAAREAWANVETDGGSLDVAVDGEVWADRSSLLTVFENLFRNSMEHASPADGDGAGRSDGGTTTTVRVGQVADGFYVEDDGPGIPDGERDRVFEHGYTTSDAGTGFGLAIVETVAETHGWSVEAAESPAGGARFVFRGAWVEADD